VADQRPVATAEQLERNDVEIEQQRHANQRPEHRPGQLKCWPGDRSPGSHLEHPKQEPYAWDRCEGTADDKAGHRSGGAEAAQDERDTGDRLAGDLDDLDERDPAEPLDTLAGGARDRDQGHKR
jgi:hypothetical protein